MRTVQIGLNWMLERPGGLSRYYYELWRASGGVFDFSGMVIGSPAVTEQSRGDVLPLAPMSASVTQKYQRARTTYARLIKDTPPQLTAAHFAYTAFPILGDLKTPLVLHFHGPWAAEALAAGEKGLRPALKAWIERRVYARAARAITLSQAFAHVLARDYNVPRSRIEVIPGGVDTTRFSPSQSKREAREILGWPADRFIVVAVRRLTPRMGLDTLIDAALLLRRAHRDLLIKIVGAGSMQPQLIKKLNELGLKDYVQCTGQISEARLPLVYRAADLSVVPTQKLEGFGLVVLESLAAGTPAIVTPIGGLPEIAAPLSSSLVTASAQVQDIAATIDQAIVSDHLPSAAACQTYAAQFAWPVIAQKVRQAYQRAL